MTFLFGKKGHSKETGPQGPQQSPLQRLIQYEKNVGLLL